MRYEDNAKYAHYVCEVSYEECLASEDGLLYIRDALTATQQAIRTALCAA